MIKGCAKRVVVVRDINSNFFEEAFFIVKAGAAKQNAQGKESDYINEAHRIVRSDLPEAALTGSAKVQNPYVPAFSYVDNKKKSSGKMRDVLMFLFGFGISAIICTVIYYSGIAL